MDRFAALLPPETLRALRLKYELSQGELAKRLECSTALVSKWESGERRIRGEMVPRIVAAIKMARIEAQQIRSDIDALLEEAPLAS